MGSVAARNAGDRRYYLAGRFFSSSSQSARQPYWFDGSDRRVRSASSLGTAVRQASRRTSRSRRVRRLEDLSGFPYVNCAPDVSTGTAISRVRFIQVNNSPPLRVHTGALSAIHRNLPPRLADTRVRFHVDREPPGLGRLVRKVAPVGGDTGRVLRQGLETSEIAAELAAVGALPGRLRRDNRGKPEDVKSSLRPQLAGEDRCSVRRDRVRILIVVASRQSLDLAESSEGTLYKLNAPSRSDRKISRRPSGVHRGRSSTLGPEVRQLKTSRAISQTQTSNSRSSITKAMRVPSGDKPMVGPRVVADL